MTVLPRTCTKVLPRGFRWEKESTWTQVSWRESEEVSCQSESALRVFLPALGPQSMKRNQTPASQSTLRTTRHGAGPHGHPPGPSDPHLHGESVTGHPAVSRSELSINARGAWPTDISCKSVRVCSYIKQSNTKFEESHRSCRFCARRVVFPWFLAAWIENYSDIAEVSQLLRC